MHQASRDLNAMHNDVSLGRNSYQNAKAFEQLVRLSDLGVTGSNWDLRLAGPYSAEINGFFRA